MKYDASLKKMRNGWGNLRQRKEVEKEYLFYVKEKTNEKT